MPAGNAKISGVAVVDDILVANDFGYGRMYFYDVSTAASPRFIGTHAAPFVLRNEINPDKTWAPSCGLAGSGKSGVYSFPLSLLNPSISTRYDPTSQILTCAQCDYVQTPATDFGGINLSANGCHMLAFTGKRKQGLIQIVDVSDPSNMVTVGSLPIVGHASRLAEIMAGRTLGNHIFAAVGNLGFTSTPSLASRTLATRTEGRERTGPIGIPSPPSLPPPETSDPRRGSIHPPSESRHPVVDRSQRVGSQTTGRI